MNTNKTTARIADLSQRKAAIVAGVTFLMMTIFGPFTEFFVRQNLIVPGDAATTANNIMANELLFRIGIFSFIIMVIFDVVLAWALYVLLKPVNKSLSSIGFTNKVGFSLFEVNQHERLLAIYIAE